MPPAGIMAVCALAAIGYVFVGRPIAEAVQHLGPPASVHDDGKNRHFAWSLSDAVQTRDLWTFRRDTGSRDPNWLLIETDEEE